MFVCPSRGDTQVSRVQADVTDVTDVCVSRQTLQMFACPGRRNICLHFQADVTDVCVSRQMLQMFACPGRRYRCLRVQADVTDVCVSRQTLQMLRVQADATDVACPGRGDRGSRVNGSGSLSIFVIS